MDMRLLFILLVLLPFIYTDRTVTCTDGFSLINNKCLKLFTTPMSRRNATKTCSSYAGNLVTIKSVEDNNDIATVVGGSTKRVWIGLYCFGNNISSCLWDDGTGSAVKYNNFAKSFPYTDIDNCVYYKITGSLAGQWLNGDCDEDLRSFVCQMSTTFEDECSLNFNGSCYYSSEEQTESFFLARIRCIEKCASVASIHSVQETRFIYNHFEKYNSDSVFIGAMSTILGRFNFHWLDGTACDYSNGDVSNINSDVCMMMALKTNESFIQGAWYNSDCDVKRNYMCKRPAGVPCAKTSKATVIPTNTSECNVFLMAPGSFASPGYPGNYTYLLNCSYNLATLGSHRIRLTFSDFDTESQYDMVKIYDGDSIDSPLIETTSGQYSTPLYYESSGNSLFVTFITDVNNSGSGFKASFFSIV